MPERSETGLSGIFLYDKEMKWWAVYESDMNGSNIAS